MTDAEFGTISDYLRTLSRYLRDLPADRRDEIITGIEDHFERMTTDDGLTIAEALSQLGSPRSIADDALSISGRTDRQEQQDVRR